MSGHETKPFPRLWFWGGVLWAVAGAGNLAVWLFGLTDPPSEPSSLFQWWLQLGLGVLFLGGSPLYFWRSRQGRRALERASESEG